MSPYYWSMKCDSDMIKVRVRKLDLQERLYEIDDQVWLWCVRKLDGVKVKSSGLVNHPDDGACMQNMKYLHRVKVIY